MGLLNHLTFDGVDSSSFGVFISGEGVFGAPARRGEMISIPGRNGSLFMDEGVYENIPGKYPAFIGTKDEVEFREKLAAFRNAILSRGNYKKLSDTYHPDEFRLAVYRSGLEVDPEEYNRSGKFELEFDCKPQRFLIEGENPIVYETSGTIINPTLFSSKPLIKVIGNGLVRIEPYEFIVSGNDGELWIDSELFETYALAHELVNLTDELNENITDEANNVIEVAYKEVPVPMGTKVEFINYVYPEIIPGKTFVVMAPTIEELTIIPRWWRL